MDKILVSMSLKELVGLLEDAEVREQEFVALLDGIAKDESGEKALVVTFISINAATFPMNMVMTQDIIGACLTMIRITIKEIKSTIKRKLDGTDSPTTSVI